MTEEQTEVYAKILVVFARAGLDLSEMHEVLWRFTKDIEDLKKAKVMTEVMLKLC